ARPNRDVTGRGLSPTREPPNGVQIRRQNIRWQGESWNFPDGSRFAVSSNHTFDAKFLDIVFEGLADCRLVQTKVLQPIAMYSMFMLRIFAQPAYDGRLCIRCKGIAEMIVNALYGAKWIAQEGGIRYVEEARRLRGTAHLHSVFETALHHV